MVHYKIRIDKHHNSTDQYSDNATDKVPAQFFQVVNERHLGLGTLLLPAVEKIH
jgi:hypothetical protein